MHHVRYGSRRVTSENCLNQLDAVQRASNKLEALKLFGNHGVPIPPHLQVGGYTAVRASRRIFRKNERHAGNDNPPIIEPNDVADLAVINTFDYCMECIDVAHEFRVHIFRQAAIILPGETAPGGRSTPPLHPLVEQGVEARHVRESIPGRVLSGSGYPGRCRALPYFGAVDVLMDQAGHFVVVEVNTAPGLNKNKASSTPRRWCSGIRNTLPSPSNALPLSGMFTAQSPLAGLPVIRCAGPPRGCQEFILFEKSSPALARRSPHRSGQNGDRRASVDCRAPCPGGARRGLVE